MFSRPISSRLDLNCSCSSSSVVIAPPPWWWSGGSGCSVGTRTVRWVGTRTGRACDSRRARIPGSTNVRTRARVSSGSVRSACGERVGAVGQHDAHGPLGRPRGLLGLEPAGEERGGQVAGHQEDPVQLGEGQVGQDGARLVGQQVGQRLVRAELAGRLDHAGHEHVLEVVGLAHDDGQRREEAGHLGLDHGGEDVLLAPGEGPVDGGPGEAGLAGDVVDRGLGDALAGQAAQRAVDDADPGRGAVVGARGGGRPRRARSAGARESRLAGRAAVTPTAETVWRFLSQCQRRRGAQLRFTWPGATR